MVIDASDDLKAQIKLADTIGAGFGSAVGGWVKARKKKKEEKQAEEQRILAEKQKAFEKQKEQNVRKGVVNVLNNNELSPKEKWMAFQELGDFAATPNQLGPNRQQINPGSQLYGPPAPAGEQINISASAPQTQMNLKLYPKQERYTGPTKTQDTMQSTKKDGFDKSPYREYPDAFLENGQWKVIRNNRKYRIEE